MQDLLASVQCEYCNGRGVVSIRAPQLNVARRSKRTQAMRCVHCDGTGSSDPNYRKKIINKIAATASYGKFIAKKHSEESR